MRALAVARRYATALRDRQTVRSLPAELDFDDAFAFALSSIGITQQPEEIRWLFEAVRELRPQTVVEIGLDEGGTLFLWTRAAPADARLIALDTRPAGRLGRLSPFPLVRTAFARGSQRIELLMATDSHDAATVERLRGLLNGAAIDFLFIDGDHSYEGVRRDFELYSPLVRSGGVVAFHDVSQRPAAFTEGTARFWREFAAAHNTESCVSDREPGFGIGIYRVP
jgi:predicted O-methyltransferase YrrM